MAFKLGTRLGPYEILSVVGAGGMGEVYRARDARLNRDVAVKVLADAGSDPARQRRFTEEARAASALNHPNILTVYDVGAHEGTPYIVSELVEGTSLRALLARAPLPVHDTLDLGVQMADGLAAAHHASIVHRDFKPENVMVTPEGRVKILDFGLARVGPREGVAAADAVETVTSTGLIMGTVPYMSPEQARGATVDYRTDQFSLGLTLYEMVTGRRAFRAETAAQTLAAIIDDEPEPIGKLNTRVPPPVRWVIERCLAKDARQRYHATADLVADLRTLRDRLAEFTSASDMPPPVARPRRGLVPVATVAAALVALAVFGAFVSAGDEGGFDRYRFTPIATDPGYQGSPAWSPDGKTLAYVAEVDGVLQVFTRAVASSMRQQVTRSRFECREPFWSPDGTRIYYISLARDRDGLWSISTAGGEAELVLENVARADLSPDGKVLAFMRPSGGDPGGIDVSGFVTLWLSSPPGAAPVRYTRQPYGSRGFSQARLRFAPDGSKLGIWAQATWADEHKFVPDFWIIPMGETDPYVARSESDLPAGAPAFSWLPDSRHIVSVLNTLQTTGSHLWLEDTTRPFARRLTATSSSENDPAVSPDGQRIAFSVQGTNYDIVELAVDHLTPIPLLATSRNEADPAWSPMGSQMAFRTDRSGRDEIWLRSASGEWERPIVTARDFASPTYMVSVPAFSPDGQRVAYHRLGPEGNRIWITPVAGGPPVQIAPGELYQHSPTWSRDGNWIAYIQALRGDWSLAKAKVGTTLAPEVLARDILPASTVSWSPDGAWIAYNSEGGLTLVAPDGKSRRVIHEEPWLSFAWSDDSLQIYGVRLSSDFRHLTFTSVDIRSGRERVLVPALAPLPVSEAPISGFSRISPTRFATSIPHVQSDVWILEGFNVPRSLWDRLGRVLRFWRQPRSSP